MNMLLTKEIIDNIVNELVTAIPDSFSDRVVRAYLFGSCARGDFNQDSDIDIAVLFDCKRVEAQKYISDAARLSTDIAMKTMQVVNFVCLPIDEFEDKKSWYPFYSNIADDGRVIYER